MWKLIFSGSWGNKNSATYINILFSEIKPFKAPIELGFSIKEI